MLARNSYAAGHFEFRIDGQEPTAYVKSAEGGWSRANISAENSGGNSRMVKQITSVELEPITVEFGLTGAKDMLQWIQESWNRGHHRRRSGQITYADFDLRAMFEHHFSEALITATTFPTLDGASKEGGYLKCTLQPESAVTRALGAAGPRISSGVSAVQKMWTPAAFRLSIDGIDDMRYVNRIDSFTVNLQTKKFQTGASRLPEVIPISLKFPNLTGTISLQYAGKLIEWHNQFIRTQEGPGIPDASALKSGAIELLSPDRKQTLLRINLSEVGLVYLGVPSGGGEGQVKRLKFELYVHRMTIEGSSILGFA